LDKRILTIYSDIHKQIYLQREPRSQGALAVTKRNPSPQRSITRKALITSTRKYLHPTQIVQCYTGKCLMLRVGKVFMRR